ncbi:aminopeptidase, partial [Candidatus Woesearchaeota archaeon]
MMMASLKKALRTVFEVCMNLKRNESCLVVSDSKKRELGLAFFEAAKSITEKSAYEEVLPPPRNGTEPLEQIGSSWKFFDVIILVTSKSFSHTKARKAACKAGARIASMPGLTEDMAKRALDVDYALMKKRSVKLARILEKGSKVRVTTALGTDLEFSIKKHKPFTDFGIYSKKGSFGNLPAGESGLAPDEGTANGILVVDACMGTGVLKEPVKITIKDGFAVKFEGKEGARVRKQFEGLG